MKATRILAALLCLVLCGALLSGCTSYESSLFDSVNQVQANPWFVAPEADPTPRPASTAAAATPTPGIMPVSTQTPAPTTPSGTEAARPTASPAAPVSGNGFEGRSDISYVMIYNPNTPADGSITSISTGYLGTQVDTGRSRADELGEANALTVSQGSFRLPDGVSIDPYGSRPGAVVPTYNKGDEHEFYATVNGMSYAAQLVNFKCLYAGEHCYIWVNDNSISETTAQSVGREFDNVIYPADVGLFGKPRYADEGGKICLLFYNIGHGEGTMGYFHPYELQMTGEMDETDAARNGINLDHAILHMNAEFANPDSMRTIYATAAHEFQHLINCTNTFIAANESNGIWINEAMSGFVEEYIYPGVQLEDGRYIAFARSGRIDRGQSLYSFRTSAYDIGVYGSVFLFSEYLANLAGTETYKNYHTYWRMSAGRSITDAEALYNSVPASVQSGMLSKYSYPSAVRFDNTHDEWLSKLALDFHISVLKYDAGDPVQYENIYPIEYLLYDEINAAYIECGGRIIFATADGTFTIPEDAESGLVYIGFDSNLNMVTDIIYH